MDTLFERLDRFLVGRPSWSSLATDGVQYWRRRVLDVAIVVGLILGAISVVPGVIRAVLEHNYVLMATDLVVLALATVVFLARGLDYRIRAGMLVGAAFGVGWVQVITSGLLNPGPVWLFAAPVMAVILFDLRAAVALIAVLMATLLGQLFAARLGLLGPALTAEVGSPRWVEVATDLTLLVIVVSLFMGILLQGLKSSFARIQRIGRDLKDERSRLLVANRELEAEIARRREAEQERSLLSTAMEQARDAVVILALDGRIEYVNRAFEVLFGRTRAHVVDRPLAGVGLFAQPLDEVLAALDEGSVWSGRLTAEGHDGPWEAMASFSTLEQAGRPARRLAVIRDISREVQLEVQLEQARKMQAIGTFAGGIAHDFNNLLVPIMGTAELLRSELQGEALDWLDDITRSARRGRELVAQILAFSRGGQRRDATVHLAAVVEDSERLLRASLPADIELRFAVDDPGPVHVSEAEAQQVLINLCTNAFHAMGGRGGTLDIRVDGVRGSDVDTASAVVASPPDPAQDYVRLTVTDTGAGMTEATLGRVFEPFFTTKPEGEGTGLGLAMVHGVTRGAEGTLVIRSVLDRGTIIEVLLPRGRDPVAETAPAVEDPRGQGQTVLVVDDEAPVRAVLGRFLERLGYRPELVGPEDGVRILESPQPLDLLITDLSMPGLTGLDLARVARRARPGLPMVLVTGLVDGPTVREASEAGFDQVLAKPFDQAELSATVALAVGRTETASPI